MGAKKNILGVTFDSKLQLTEQVSNTIKKGNEFLATKLISKFFNVNEIKNLPTSNFYSVLYYNSEIWHLPKLNPYLKNLLMSTSIILHTKLRPRNVTCKTT